MNGLKKPKERLIKLGLENSLAKKVCSFVTCLSPTSPTGEWGNTSPFFVGGRGHVVLAAARLHSLRYALHHLTF